MKKSIFLLVIIFLLKTGYTQILLYPKLPSDPINDLHYISNKEIIFINDGGCIYKSYDAGNSWKLKVYFNNLSLNRITFVSDSTGFVFPGSTNEVIYTNDAGESWHTQQLTISDANAILPISESVMLKATYSGDILRLNNFYDRWDTTYRMPTYVDSTIIIDFFPKMNKVKYTNYPYGGINYLEELPSGNIIALANNDNAINKGIVTDSANFILKSTDEGLNWDTLWIGLKNDISCFSFNNDSVGWMSYSANPSILLKTTNGGHNWTMQDVLNNDFTVYNIFELDNQSVFMLTNEGCIKTLNSGINWETSPLNVDYQSKSYFFDNNNGFIYGGTIFMKTDNSGLNWIRVDSSIGDDAISVDFVNPDTGLVLGKKGIYKTINGGTSWTTKFTAPQFTYPSPSLVMLNNSTGWATPVNDKLYKTTDLGETWNEIKLSDKKWLYGGIVFCNDSLGIIYCVEEEKSPGFFVTKYNLVTTDGGVRWTKEDVDTSSDALYFDKVEFVDPNHLWAINRYGLWLSTDTARTWKKMYKTDYFVGTYSFDFYDENIGILANSYFNYNLTTDGGKTWVEFAKPTGCMTNDCKILGPDFSGDYRAIECGRDGKLEEYDFNGNGEISYSRQLGSFTQRSLNNINVFVQNDFPYTWIVGDGFTVLYRQYEKIFTGIYDKKHEISNFELFQNYPNPFNPTTTIKYSIPSVETRHASSVQLKVYDILGRLVAALVNKEQRPGNYKVQFNASQLASGIYFYRLKYGSFIQTKKMILLK